MKLSALILLCLISFAGYSQGIDNGLWVGHISIQKDEKSFIYNIEVKLNSNYKNNETKGWVRLFDWQDSSKLIGSEDMPFYYNPSNHVLSFGLTIEMPNGSKVTGRYDLSPDGNNLTRALGKFTPLEKTNAKVEITLHLFFGNPLLKDDDPFGKIAPNAVYIDATEIDDFHEGLAIIRKADQFAVIDKNGKFLVDYGKYKFNEKGGYEIDKNKCRFHNAVTVVRDDYTEKYGFLDMVGNLIVPCTLSDAEPFQEDGYGWGKEIDEHGKEHYYYYNIQGKKFPSKQTDEFYKDWLYVYPVSEDGYTSFYGKNSRFIFKTKRRITGKYSDGLIKVDSSFELAGRKTGFIDTANKLVIPYKFIDIHDFFKGLALIQGHSQDEFLYRYIDKKGNPVITLRYSDEIKDVFNPSDFNTVIGYALVKVNNQLAYLDMSGKVNFFNDMIARENANPNSDYAWFWKLNDYKIKSINTFSPVQGQYHYTYIPFSCSYAYNVPIETQTGGVGGGRKMYGAKEVRKEGVGLLDYTNGSVIIPPVFSELGFCDRSGLSKATYHNDQTNETIEGYVNSLGQFVIVKTKK